ncbi:thermonuclease family protein [Terricaulis sp.]|uniref:thermonuclease family protein n=1 Tax=Terricaulis sp. TaxID=2768686 RepID=UPI003784B514
MVGIVFALLVMGSDLNVIDADSFTFRGHYYRLYNIDAPQGGQTARCNSEIAQSQDTAAYVRARIASAGAVDVRPAFDPRGSGIWPHDRARARLARIYVDGQDLSEILIAEGRAAQMDIRTEHDWCRNSR